MYTFFPLIVLAHLNLSLNSIRLSMQLCNASASAEALLMNPPGIMRGPLQKRMVSSE